MVGCRALPRQGWRVDTQQITIEAGNGGAEMIDPVEVRADADDSDLDIEKLEAIGRISARLSSFSFEYVASLDRRTELRLQGRRRPRLRLCQCPQRDDDGTAVR